MLAFSTNILASSIEAELKKFIADFDISPQMLLPGSAIDFSRVLHRFTPSYRGSLSVLADEPAKASYSDRRLTARTPRARDRDISTGSGRKYSYTPKRQQV